MGEQLTSSQVAFIKDAILGFVGIMNSEKRSVEQQIRERTENQKGQFFAQGATQFTYTQVNQLCNQLRDEYLGLYQNTIHLKLLAAASMHMRQSIEHGLINAGLVQEEWVNAFNNMQDQLNQYEAMASQLENTEMSLEVERQKVSDLTTGAKISASDLSQFETIMEEKDQLIAEKEQEVINLSEGLSRMEQQMNNLGQTMLQNSMTIEELQSVIGDKDQELDDLKLQLKSSSGSNVDVDGLREQLRASQLRISELESQASAASGDLVNQLQDNLQKSRDELLKVRKELVTKNEELYEVKLQYEESNTVSKRAQEQITNLDAEYKKLKTMETEFSTTKSQLDELKAKSESLEVELTTAKDKLSNYEGKATISAEEQERFNKQIEELNQQIKKADETISFFRTVLGQDVKFKALLYLESVNEEIRLDTLSKGIGLSQDSVHRAIVELSESGLATARKEGRYLYVTKNGQSGPFSIGAIMA